MKRKLAKQAKLDKPHEATHVQGSRDPVENVVEGKEGGREEVGGGREEEEVVVRRRGGRDGGRGRKLRNRRSALHGEDTGILLKMDCYCSTTVWHYWDMSVK